MIKKEDGTMERLRCDECQHRREVPGNCHITCTQPDKAMTGDPHGVRNGWFFYPILFDPTWATKECTNFSSIRPAVSHAVSDETGTHTS